MNAATRAQVRDILRPHGLQPKLTIGHQGDRYEQEADLVADRVLSGLPVPEISPLAPGSLQTQPIEEEEELLQPNLQRQPLEEEEEEMQMKPLQRQAEEEEWTQRKPATDNSIVTNNVNKRLNKAGGTGSALPDNIREYMGSQFGYDFNEVKVHADGEATNLARSLSANAFTSGKDIYFGSGKYNPNSTQGKRLVAHELTHVVQQDGGLHRKMTFIPFGQVTQREVGQEEAQSEQKLKVPPEDFERIKETAKKRYGWENWEDISAKPYLPTESEYSERYHKLSPKDRAKVNEVIDYIYLQQLSCPIPKLDWFKPTHRPWARRWLRIRDKVMQDVWTRHAATTGGKVVWSGKQQERPPENAPYQSRSPRDFDIPEAQKSIREACDEAMKKGGVPKVLKDKYTLKSRRGTGIYAIHPDEIKREKDGLKKGQITILIPWYNEAGESPLDRSKESIDIPKEGKKEVKVSPLVSLHSKERQMWFHGLLDDDNTLIVEHHSENLKNECGLEHTMLFRIRQYDLLVDLWERMDEELWENLQKLVIEEKHQDRVEVVSKRAKEIFEERKKDAKKFVDDERNHGATDKEIAKAMSDQWSDWSESFGKELGEEFSEEYSKEVAEVAPKIKRKMLSRWLNWFLKYQRLENPTFPSPRPRTPPQKKTE